MEGISVTHIDFFKLVPTVYRGLGGKIPSNFRYGKFCSTWSGRHWKVADNPQVPKEWHPNKCILSSNLSRRGLHVKLRWGAYKYWTGKVAYNLCICHLMLCHIQFMYNKSLFLNNKNFKIYFFNIYCLISKKNHCVKWIITGTKQSALLCFYNIIELIQILWVSEWKL